MTLAETIQEYYADNGKKIRSIADKVIKKFGGICQKDYDDFYSAINEAVSQALIPNKDGTYKYDPSKGTPEGYLYRTIVYTIMSEVSKKNASKRTADRTAKSIDAPVNDDEDFTIQDTLASGFNIEDEVSDDIGFKTDEKVETYLDSLPRTAREIIKMKMDGVPVCEIKLELNLTNSEYNSYMQTAKINENLALFAKTISYKENNGMLNIMPIDTTDNYRMDKYPLGSLLDEKRDKKINCKYILQRKAYQWTDRQINKFLTRVLNNQPIPEIVICEKYVNGRKKRYLTDGLQRLSYAELYRSKGIIIGKTGAEFPDIYYKEKVFDENGNPAIDEDGDYVEEIKTFNVIGKTFDELPDFLKERFNKFNINVTTYFNCTDEQVAYHIRNYNNTEGMNNNQYELTNVSPGVAEMLRNVSDGHPFFKDNYGQYTEKKKTKGNIDRLVVESIMTINFLDDWKKSPQDAFNYINDNATKKMFDDLKEILDRLCNIVDKNNKELFTTTNSSVWFAVFSKFEKLELADTEFLNFMNYFQESFDTLEIDGNRFRDIYKDSHTKNKNIVMAKIMGIEQLMLDFLHIKNEEVKECSDMNKEAVVDINIKPEQEISPNDSDTILAFVQELVGDTLTANDIKDFEEDLEIRSLDVDNNNRILESENHKSLIALIAYAYQQDLLLDKWFLDFFHRHNTYNQNQKENYIYMKNDLEKFLDKKGAVT